MKKTTLIFLGFVIIKFILQYTAINPVYELQRDEYLHLDQANHLAWGYISVPPFTSRIAFIIKLLGNGVFWVKFFPALFGTLTMLVVWKTIEALNGSLFALCLGAAAITFSVLVRINTLFQPNSTDIFFWTLFFYILVKYISSENVKWLYAAGIAAGFGLLSKYNFAFLLLGLLPAILLTRHRQVFTKKAFYIAVGIAFIIVLPNLVWQYQNNFPTMHQLNELVKTQLNNVNRTDFIKEQLLFFINSLFVIIAAFIALFIYPPFKKYQLFVWNFVFTIALFIWFKAKGYYAIGLYPVFIAFGAVYLETALNSGWKKYLQPVILILVTLLSIPLLLIALPYKSPVQIKKKNSLYKKLGLLRWEDGKDHDLPMDFADMVGWKELAEKTDSVYAAVTDKENTLVLCDNYGQAGAINYFSAFKNIRAVSFNADYINWMPLEKNINNVILIKFHTDKDTGREKEKPLFKTILLKGKIENDNAIEAGTTIYLLQGATTSINQLIEKEIRERKIHK